MVYEMGLSTLKYCCIHAVTRTDFSPRLEMNFSKADEAELSAHLRARSAVPANGRRNHWCGCESFPHITGCLSPEGQHTGSAAYSTTPLLWIA